MADDAATFLLQKLEDVVKAHISLISGARNELKKLEGDVGRMQAHLKDLRNQSSPTESTKQYEREMRDIVNEAEDILEECTIRAALNNSKLFSRMFSPKQASMAKQVKSFRDREITPFINRYMNFAVLGQQNGQTNPVEPSRTGNDVASTSKSPRIESFQHETNTRVEPSSKSKGKGVASIEQEDCMRQGSVVGLDAKADEIIDLLSEATREHEVIAITGMDGIGKTTLARKVYDSENGGANFNIVIWVEIGQDFNKIKVFHYILKKLNHNAVASTTSYDLANSIKCLLKYRKFLLIFDDVRNVEDWDEIKKVLPNNGSGRVLITCPSENVAKRANPRRDPFKLGFLDASKSWDLLQLQVFHRINECPPSLEDVGRKIALKCGGLPFAIVVIGGVLHNIRTTATGVNEAEKEWRQVSDSVPEFVNDEEEFKKNVMERCYNELRPDLRYCFLYMGVFPKERSIPIRSLFNMWIAEGFVCGKESPNKTPEEVALDNLKELIDRNLVMDDTKKADGYRKTCSIHPVIREFCKNMASLKNHNLFEEMRWTSEQGTATWKDLASQNLRRICIHSHIPDFLRLNLKGPRVHSLLCSAEEAITLLPEESSPIPPQFKRLRVVDVSPIKLTKFPSKLDHLIHLRYIVLSSADGDGDDMWALPKEVSKLWNLQSITIHTNSRVFEIKANLWKMMNLVHLKTKAAIVLREKMEGPAGEQLQSVSRLSTQSCTEGVFNKAKNLQKLGICGDLNTISKVSLRSLENLQKLKLLHDVYPTVVSEKPLSGLSIELFPSKLKVLQLSRTFLTWNRFCDLAKLPALENLRLKNQAFKGDIWYKLDMCFESLQILIIEDTDLETWEAEDGYFPKLQCLALKKCAKLKGIPFGITRNLKKLHVENVSEDAVESAKKIAAAKQEQSSGMDEFELITKA